MCKICFCRMPFVNNQTFLALAKADFNYTQKKYQLELEDLVRLVKDSCDFQYLDKLLVKHG